MKKCKVRNKEQEVKRGINKRKKKKEKLRFEDPVFSISESSNLTILREKDEMDLGLICIRW